MKKINRKLYTILGVIIISLMVVAVAYAFTVGNVDGVWGNIDGVTATSGLLTPIDVIGGYDPSEEPAVGCPNRNDQRHVRSTGICAGDPDGDITFAQYTNTTSPVWTDLGSHTTGTCTTLTTGLFFSEYVRDQATDNESCSSTSTSSNDCDLMGIEIYNGTASSIDLSAYSLLFFTGERGSISTVALNSTSLAAGGRYVIVNYRASGSVSGENQTINNNNNYRAVALVPEGTATQGARCNRWATGNGNTPTVMSGWLTSVQDLVTTDENQVRYGRDAFDPENPTSWSSLSCQVTNFANQSGFGFDGNNGPVTPVVNTPFYLGRFTHYNNQIFSTDDSYENAQPLEYVPLTVRVPVTCNDGSTPTPASFSFTPIINLDETSNSAGTCVYDDDGNYNGIPCPDRVIVEMPSAGSPFTCPDGQYTVVINGFTTRNLDGGLDCSLSYNSASVSTIFITQEETDNHACLWASITAPTADIAPIKTCQIDGDGWVTSYTIVTTNVGPGASMQPTLSDTLPTSVNYVGYTSKMYTTLNPTGSNQGSCTYNTSSRLFSCQLLTALPAPGVDANARWEVVIDVTEGTGTNLTNQVTVSSNTTDPNTSNNVSTAECNPTAITLVSFTATSVGEEIVLDWETASEYNTLGYNLYRASSEDGERLRVNLRMIPSNVAPGSMEGALYTYTDTVPTEGEYYYWLEEVEINGSTPVYGPAVVIFK